VLDLGEVKELVQVSINGNATAFLWYTPFSIDITKYVRPGKNQLGISLTNTWANRLIGDKNVPKEEQICKFCSPDPKLFKANYKFPFTGLLGTIVIKTEK
jgi:hypothetical protein